MQRLDLSPRQELELDSELPPEVLDHEQFEEDAWFPILRYVYYAGYAKGTADALAGKAWALRKRVLGR